MHAHNCKFDKAGIGSEDKSKARSESSLNIVTIRSSSPMSKTCNVIKNLYSTIFQMLVNCWQRIWRKRKWRQSAHTINKLNSIVVFTFHDRLTN